MSEELRPELLMESPDTSLGTIGGSELSCTLLFLFLVPPIFSSVILVSYIS